MGHPHQTCLSLKRCTSSTSSCGAFRITNAVRHLCEARSAARRGQLLPARSLHRLRGNPQPPGRASRRDHPAGHRALDRNALHLPTARAGQAPPMPAARFFGDRGPRTAEPDLRLSCRRHPRRVLANTMLGMRRLDPVVALSIARLAITGGRRAWRGESCSCARCGPQP